MSVKRPRSLLRTIIVLGGCSIDEKSDLTGGDSAGVPVGFFQKDGAGLDDLATRLHARGFLLDHVSSDGGVQQLRDWIQDEIAGRNFYYSAFDGQLLFDWEKEQRAVSHKKKRPRSQRIDSLTRRYARRCEETYGLNRASKKYRMRVKRPLKRHETRHRIKPMIAYDLETTRIREGTPEPLYITWFGSDCKGSLKVESLKHLGEIVIARLLVPEFNKVRFVAWNGNNFDVYIIAAALLDHPGYVMRPYLTRSKNLRGLRVTHTPTEKNEGYPYKGTQRVQSLSWEFLDGMAMTGASAWPNKSLKFFLERFAPDYGKLPGPDFEREDFDAGNPAHVAYAERDSEGLYHGMQKAQSIVLDTFGVPLYPTIGNTSIRIFTRNMPQDVIVWEPPWSALQVIRDTVMRGGFCICVKRFEGPIWKYDLNQAYAAAMRDVWLPAGRCIHIDRVHKYANAAIYRIEASNAKNRVPFYYRDSAGDSVYGAREITDTWVTIEELQQLQRERWDIKVIEGWFWSDVFNMRDYVNQLEKLRGEAEGGPGGAIGLMVKAVGNNSYGKTVERLDGLELVLSRECPEGFYAYQDADDLFKHVWAKIAAPVPREYHQPQLGSFITAHVRMLLRRAALMDVDAWLYADTDASAFSRPVLSLNLDPKRYGFWKLEVDGEPYRIINKKTYAKVGVTVDGSEKHAKGLNVRRLTDADFEAWFKGVVPIQQQLQKQNFIKVMTGFDMFATRIKRGEVEGRAHL